MNVACGAGADSSLTRCNSAPNREGTMSKKSDRIAKKAAATVAKRHAGDKKVTEKATDASMPQAVTKPTRAPRAAKEVKEGALPALPKLPSSARPRKEKAKQPCACGCETPTTGTWAPGHDARARGWALRIDRGIMKLAGVPANEQAGAKYMLKVLKEEAANPTPKAAKAAKTGPKLVKPSEPVAEPEAAAETVAEPEAEPATAVGE